jgi:hypothetical protein
LTLPARAPTLGLESRQRDAKDLALRWAMAIARTLAGFAKLMTPIVAKTMRSEVSQLDRLRAILES